MHRYENRRTRHATCQLLQPCATLQHSFSNGAREQMPRYEIIIYWSQADDAFIAEVPELPGCAADGKTYKEALANVEIIIPEWIETAKELGRPIPAPRGRLTFA